MKRCVAFTYKCPNPCTRDFYFLQSIDLHSSIYSDRLSSGLNRQTGTWFHTTCTSAWATAAGECFIDSSSNNSPCSLQPIISVSHLGGISTCLVTRTLILLIVADESKRDCKGRVFLLPAKWIRLLGESIGTRHFCKKIQVQNSCCSQMPHYHNICSQTLSI